MLAVGKGQVDEHAKIQGQGQICKELCWVAFVGPWITMTVTTQQWPCHSELIS